MDGSKPTTFPDVFVWDIGTHFEDNFENIGPVVRRPIRPTDPSRTIAIVAENWEPDSRPYVIGQNAPLISKYQIDVWCFVSHLVEAEGIVEHGKLARNVRRMLASDATLLGTLRSEVDTDDTGIERVQRVTIEGQRFLANDLDASRLFLSITRLVIETEYIG